VRRHTKTRRNAQTLAKITSGYVCLPDAGKAKSRQSAAVLLSSSPIFDICETTDAQKERPPRAAVSPKSDQVF
jgi:hypothetical protein